MDISSQEIEAIVKQVLAGMGGAQTSAAPAAYTAAPGGAAGDRGVFENVDDAVEAAWKAQRDWAANYKIEDRQRIIEAIRRCARAHVEEWCHKIVEETPDDAPCDGSLLTNARQADAIVRAKKSVDAALCSLRAGFTPDAVLVDLEAAMRALGEVTGRTMREDITNRIFERFCVGK